MGLMDFLSDIPLVGNIFSGINALTDSLGFSQHGRDQYFARDMQREFLNNQIQAQKDAQKSNQDFSLAMYERQVADTLKNYPEFAKMASDAQFNLWKNQFDAQNAYNSPSAQVSRMMSAGLNPAQGTQGVAVNQMGSSSVSPPPTISGSPLGGSVSPIGLPQGLSANGAELANIGSFFKDLATIKKLGSEKIGVDLENAFKEKTLDARIEKVALDNGWTKEQTNLLQQQFSEITAKLNLMRIEGELNEKQLNYFDEKMSAEIADIKASKEYKDTLAKLDDKQRELLDSMFDDLVNYQSYNSQLLERAVELSNRYGDAQAIVGMLTEVVGAAVDVASLFTPKKIISDVTSNVTSRSHSTSHNTNVNTSTNTNYNHSYKHSK